MVTNRCGSPLDLAGFRAACAGKDDILINTKNISPTRAIILKQEKKDFILFTRFIRVIRRLKIIFVIHVAKYVRHQDTKTQR
jgi:hypothetical protein